MGERERRVPFPSDFGLSFFLFFFSFFSLFEVKIMYGNEESVVISVSVFSIRWEPKGNGLNPLPSLRHGCCLLSLFVWEFAFGTLDSFIKYPKSSFNLTYHLFVCLFVFTSLFNF